MTIKLVVLKSGEDVIADVQEMIIGQDENQKVIGYFFNKPCVVKLTKSDQFSDESTSFGISIFPWCPMSKDTSIPVPTDWVVTLVEPIEKLKLMYESKVLMYGKENDKNSVSTEQSDSDQSD